MQSQPIWMQPRFQNVAGAPVLNPQTTFQAGLDHGQPVPAEYALPPNAVKANPVKANAAKGAVVDADSSEKQKKESSHGNASKWVTAYKLCFSLFVAGAANAFLFGVPIWVAGGLSALVSSAQSAIALKIHQEDTEYSRKLVHSTRKLMGRENDKTPAGKEWAMVPIWGGACGTMALVEAGFNHWYSKSHKEQKDVHPVDKIQERIDKIKARGTGKGSLSAVDQLQFRLYQLQLRSVKKTQEIKSMVQRILKDNAKNIWGERVGGFSQSIWKKLDKNVRGHAKVGYVVGFVLASIGGMVQTSIAAKIQEKIDSGQIPEKPDKKDSSRQKPETSAASDDRKKSLNPTPFMPAKQPYPEFSRQ